MGGSGGVVAVAGPAIYCKSIKYNNLTFAPMFTLALAEEKVKPYQTVALHFLVGLALFTFGLLSYFFYYYTIIILSIIV